MERRGSRDRDTAIVRRERRIGNWGRASEHIGARWEVVGLQRLCPLLEGEQPWPHAGHRPVGWLALAADPEMQLTLNRAGLPSPDVVVGLTDADGTPLLQAVDMKWHLEFASYRQISADTLRELVERGVSGLNEQLRERIGLDGERARFVDGLLLAPDIAANRSFLASEENSGQEYPITRDDVIFAEVDGREFFSALPGWEMAQLLAQFDRLGNSLRHAEGAERYYRLGAGLQGAAAALLSSIFVEQPPPIEASAAFAWLRSKFPASTTSHMAQDVDRRMAGRSQLLARLREVLRSPFRLGDLAATLRRHHLAMPDNIEDDSPHAARARDLLKQVSLLHKQAVRHAGLDLVRRGATDGEALATLARESNHFRRVASANADRLVKLIYGDQT